MIYLNQRKELREMKISERIKKHLMNYGYAYGKMYYYVYNRYTGVVKKYSMWENGTLAELVEKKVVDWE